MSHSPESPRPEQSIENVDSNNAEFLEDLVDFSSEINDEQRSAVNRDCLDMANTQLISIQKAAHKMGIDIETSLSEDSPIDGLRELCVLTEELVRDKDKQLSVSEAEFIDYMSTVQRLTEARTLLSDDKLGAYEMHTSNGKSIKVTSPDQALAFEFERRKKVAEKGAKKVKRMIDEGVETKRDLNTDIQRNLALGHLYGKAKEFVSTRLDGRDESFGGKQFMNRFDSESYKPENDQRAIDMLRDRAYRNNVESYALIAIARDDTPRIDLRREGNFDNAEQRKFRKNFENKLMSERTFTLPPEAADTKQTDKKTAAQADEDKTSDKSAALHDKDSKALESLDDVREQLRKLAVQLGIENELHGEDSPTSRNDTSDTERNSRHSHDDDVTSDTQTDTARQLDEFDRMAIEAERSAAEENYQEALHLYAKRKNNNVANENDQTMWQQAIHRLMLTDPTYSKLLSEESDVRPEVKQALINKYYVEKFSDLRKASLQDQVKSHEKSFTAFMNRHQKKIKIGGYLLAGISAVTGNVPAAIFFSAAVKATTAGAKYNDKKAKEFFAADTGEAGSISFINSQKSLTRLREIGQESGLDIANSAFEILSKEHSDVYMETVKKAKNDRITKSLGVSAAWFAGIMVGGHMGAQFLDYQAHGAGGFMDHVNHLSDPNGVTPWRPTVDKPIWLNSYTPMVAATLAGGGALLYAQHKYSSKPKTSKNTHRGGRHRLDENNYADLGRVRAA